MKPESARSGMEKSGYQACDVVIAGGGPAGLASALSFAREGWSVCVVEPAPERVLAAPAFDGREIALTHHTRRWLENYGVWHHIAPEAVCPLRIARVETGQNSQNPLLFEPSDGQYPHDAGSPGREGEEPPEPAREKALGYLVANHLIRKALYDRVREVQKAGGRITLLCGQSVVDFTASRQKIVMLLRHESPVHNVAVHDAALAGGPELQAQLLVAADGRFSQLRDKAGIGAITHDFGTAILVCRMRHPLPHHETALQWFDEHQTVALLPVASHPVASHKEAAHHEDDAGGSVSSLVLTLPPEEIARLKVAPEDVFNAEITARTRSRLGALHLESARITYPLKAVYAHRFHERRFALVGDAAVGMHPITAHGFNFGIKGQETLLHCLKAGYGDLGDASALARFGRQHRRDTAALFAATNAIAVAYTRDERPFLLARRMGLSLAQRLSPFKRAVTRLLMDPVKEG